ncbi:hypothetical protein NC796_15515 [Aliifodinibius sp. S!AR15-10]|uniref:hypothetical protein n=1 Tax=Aliifodinibius sp. S!AR15-10 TaxID=2950437 RepID=UPI00285871F1|nr:hypothetical protein [Aliifodinibius sp. S!AR15-10]MDR8392563.1 hypothetical protein [Aliifodinibius sp. S!AR15-10]
MYSIVLICSLSLVLMSCGTSSDDEASNVMEIISINPESPADLSYGEFVIITYEYMIDNSEGARMWVQPYTSGSISPRFLYSSSSVFHGDGGREVGVSIDDGDDPVTVDQLRVVMVSPDQSETLFETYIGVEYNFNE